MKRTELVRKSPMPRSGFKPAETKPARGAKKRKCKVCRSEFAPMSVSHKACSVDCALELVKATNLARERKEDRQRKQALKAKRDYVKDAQIAFNAYVRARDADKPCICCGVPLQTEAVGGGYDCGHYRSVGSAPHLRFHEDNAHGQTKKCNRYGAGRAVDYRIGLIARIGLSRVEALEADQAPRLYTVDDLIGITKHYRQKLKELRAKCVT